MLRPPRALSALIATMLGTASVVASVAPSPAAAAAASDADITVHLDDVIHQDFLGIGVNLIPVSLMPNNGSKGYTLAHWEMDRKRIQTLEPAVARVWFQPDWVETEKGVYDFDSEKMTAFYAYLDTLQDAGTEIELNYGWKVGRDIQDWFSIPGVEARISAPADLDAFAAGASALLHELVDNRGYDNIDYLAFYNEPNGNWDFEAPGSQVGYYADMVRGVHDRLTADGLRDGIEIWGPEEWGSTPWTQYMKDHVDDAIDAYSFHVYGGTYDDLSAQISSRKTIAGDKPVVLTEFGFSGNYDSSYEAGYGNYAIKMANEGLRGGLVWQLNGVWVEDPDETTDTNDTYTLWDSLLTTPVPNPRFAEAGLLSRYVPKHSDVLRVETSSPEVRAAAFRSPDGEVAVLVETDDGEESRELTVSYEGGTVDAPIHRFLYDDQVSLDANALLPAVTATFPAGATFTDTLSERRAVAVYTTESPEVQVAVAPATGTVVSGQTLQLAATVIDGESGVTWSTAGTETPGTVTSSGLFTAPDVDEPVMVAVRATSSADPSSSGVALLNVSPAPSATRVDQPQFGLAPATYTGPQTIPVTTSTPGATIHYTTDGTTPTAASAAVDGAVTLNTSAVLKVIAVKGGVTDSPVTSGLFRVKPNPGGPDGYQRCATEDQVCEFPGIASVAYGANGNYTYGVFDGRVRCSSAVFGSDPAPGSPKKCFFQTDTADRVAKPRITPAGGTFGAAQEVTITSATEGAEVRYTTDGSFPTAASTPYTAPITVDSTTWIKAVAIAADLEPSPLAVVSFSIVDTSGGPDGYEFCAAQFQTCSFPGSAVVAYGAKGSFVYQAFTAPAQCDGASFGGVDPAPNVAKRCCYQPIGSNTTQPVDFTPAPGAYSTAQSVTLSSATDGAVIHYTTDGTTATARSPVYSEPVAVSATTTLSALAVADGKDPSPVVSGTYTIGSVNGGGPEGYTLCASEFQTCEFSGLATVAFGSEGSYFYQQFQNSALCTTTTFGGDPAFNKAKKCWYRNVSAGAVADPVFSPTAGTYSEQQAVTITSATLDATIHYTTDGSEPTAESPQYAAPVIIAQSTTVKAIAMKDGLSSSSVVSAAYVIDTSTVSTPTFSPGGGSYTSAQTVTITTATPDATTRYTLDGTTPTTESSPYTSPVGIATTKSLRAVAFKDGMTASPVATAEYTITTNPGGPEGYTFCANEWSVCDFDGTAHVAFGANGSYFYGAFTDGVGCYPANFGGDPAFNTPKKCFIRLGGLDATQTPTFTPAGGPYATPQSVTINAPGTIHYTTDGSTPDPSSPVYSAPIQIPVGSTTIKAIAIEDGKKASEVATAAYVVTAPTVAAAPTLSLPSGIYLSKRTATITSATPGAVIRYTTNGSSHVHVTGLRKVDCPVRAGRTPGRSLRRPIPPVQCDHSGVPRDQAVLTAEAGPTSARLRPHLLPHRERPRDVSAPRLNLVSRPQPALSPQPIPDRVRAVLAWLVAALLVATGLTVAPAAPAAAAPSATTVSINTSQVVNQDFLGIGVNLIPVSLMPNNLSKGYDAAYWEMDAKRIQTLEPKVARVWFQPDWMEQTKGVYDWTSPKMLAFYKYLDALKAAGTEIELNYGWKVARAQQSWFSIPGVEGRISAPADLDAFAAGASALLNELITNRGYDNVDYLAFYNEPNGYWDFEAPDEAAYYSQMVRKVHDKLVQDGRRTVVKIWGPEEWNSAPWTQHMFNTSNDILDAYSFHVYGGTYSDLSTQISSRKSIIGSKPLVLSEFGFAGNYDSWWGAGYGNYVIKMANEGVKSGLIWQLNGVWVEDPDETTDTNDTYTLWDSTITNDVPNPRYYEAGLLSRYVPEHSDVLSVSTGSPDVRATAFRTAGGDYTVLVETNENADGRALTFNFGANINKTFNKFMYTDAVVPEANALLPARSGTFTATSSFTDTTINGARNVIIYTTQAPETQVAMAPTKATVTSGQTTHLSANVIDGSGSVTWSVVGSGNGSINSSGIYTAPAVTQPTRVAVRATSTSSPSSYGISLIQVLPAASSDRVGLPEFSLTGGTYTGTQSLTITTPTSGATIHYTLDGSTPTSSSPTYTGPVSLAGGTASNTYVVKAVAFTSGLTASATTAATYRILAGSVGGPAGYTYCATESQMCGFPGTASVAYGANGSFLYGTFDRRVSCDSSQFGGDPAPGVQKKCFYLASSPLTTAAAPAFSPGGGTFPSALTVALGSTTAGATIRFTADGSTPSSTSPAYTGPISIASTTTVKAIATKAGLSDSSVSSATYTITGPSSGGPAGYTHCADEFGTCTFSGIRSVAFGASGSFTYGTFTGSAVCNAATFGGDPAYNQPKKCYAQSAAPLATPAFSPSEGTFTSPLSVSVSTSTSGASIRYTTDNSTPTSASTLYTGPITVSETTTLKAIATKTGSPDSVVASATYIISSGGSGTPAGYTYCADEFSTCTFSGTKSVAFGANGSFAYGTFTGSAVCNAAAFGGDPAYNQPKKCYYRP